MTEPNPGDIIKFAKRIKALSALAKVRAFQKERGWWPPKRPPATRPRN